MSTYDSMEPDIADPCGCCAQAVVADTAAPLLNEPVVEPVVVEFGREGG